MKRGAMRLTPEQLVDMRARVAGRPSVVEMRDASYELRRSKKPGGAGSGQKYANEKVVVDGVKFDSKAEARYWRALQTRLRAGEIANLRRQVVFELAPGVVIGGRKRPSLRYIADFVWTEDGREVVADVKGAEPSAYRIKRHLMKSVHGIDIMEIRS